MSTHRFLMLMSAALIFVAACTPGIEDTGTSRADVPSIASPEGSPLETSPVVLSDFDRVLSGDVTLEDGFEVPTGEVWAFDPAVSTVVEVGGNVVVRGSLVMRPSSGEVVHTLRFVGIDEALFRGGGMEPVPTDVGLWVVADGMLDLQGTPVAAWSYEWQAEWVGDEVVAAPHTPGDYTGFLPVDGPSSVPEPNALGYSPELLNLTRNVRIEGTAAGYAHVFIHSTRPQVIRFTAIRYVGPDLQDES
ncbi:MAG: hypothetical protein ABFR53_03635, partial [Actinomycetota bacterium]